MKRLRCAIYTRKSSEEGLDQAFNSLDAQREACEAYIKSQAGEGWHLVRTGYDDGGVSGGTLERPGLQALLTDIEAGKVNVVVTYKVDRLTRSLTDFARLVEVFDAHGVSFVSITQAFNTTTSMGRLTLNVLLSFAQFEREVTAERIRDKIAASKKKGMWMGGVVPIGYDVEARKLVINPAEAATVRKLFRLYLQHGNARLVKEKSDRLGLRTKARKPNNGARPGAASFTRGHIYQLLANSIYVGKIYHKGERYPGEHAPIIDRKTWEAVQAQLERNAARRRHPANAKYLSLLAGLLHDGEGRPMTPSHANKAGRRYRYYITRLPKDPSPGTEAIWRLPAPTLEEVTLKGIHAFLKDRLRLSETLDLTKLPPDHVKAILSKASHLGDRICDAGPGEQRQLLLELVSRIDVQQDRLRMTFCAESLRCRIGHGKDQSQASGPGTLPLDIPARFRRCGAEMKLVMTDERVSPANPDPRLIATVARAHLWSEELRTGVASSVGDLVTRHGVDQGDVSRCLPLAFLAPDIVEAILQGRQPVELTAARLKRIRLSLSWAEQRRLLGFES
jgi:DNA invertase Pin-like site-specific DNA recombinase